VKTNRRDAVSLARLSRAGELTAVWVPDERHEAMRDLSRARGAAKKDLQGKRRQISSLMLRLGRCYPGKKTWGPTHMKWLRSQKLEHREQRMAPKELLEGVRQESERVERLQQAIREAVPEWSLAELVTAVQAMRGFDLIAAVAVVAETGDLTRFQNPRELMRYLGLVPSESSTGNKVNRGGITKAGNARARHMLVEAAWSYRYPPRVSRQKQPKVAALRRDGCGRSHGTRKRGCADASGHLSAKVSGQRSSPRRLPASYRHSFGRSIARSLEISRHSRVRDYGRLASWRESTTRSTVHLPQPTPRGIVADINRAGVRAGPRQGNSRTSIMWPIVRSTPDARPGQLQTKKRKCGIQPAHQSLFTDVFGSRSLLCTIHRVSLHDPPRKPPSRQYAGRSTIACIVLDLGHQNGMARPCSAA
jgi:transposase